MAVLSFREQIASGVRDGAMLRARTLVFTFVILTSKRTCNTAA